MIFKQYQQVLDGTKTQTRRPVKKGEACRDGMSVAKTWVNVVLGLTGHRAWEPYYPKWQVGRTYAVQPGRGKKAVGRIRITEIRRERVQSINRIDAQKEGVLCPNCQGYHSRTCNCIHLFEKLWDSIYAGTEFEFAANPEVWVLTFEVVK